MRRALVSIPESNLKELDALSEIQHVSRSELIRQAVAQYLEKLRPSEKADDAFGLWRDRQVDGLDYEARLRAEW
jgi:metal-responsive CopG/Arc/MetJ family transcriptional regulator